MTKLVSGVDGRGGGGDVAAKAVKAKKKKDEGKERVEVVEEGDGEAAVAALLSVLRRGPEPWAWALAVARSQGFHVPRGDLRRPKRSRSALHTDDAASACQAATSGASASVDEDDYDGNGSGDGDFVSVLVRVAKGDGRRRPPSLLHPQPWGSQPRGRSPGGRRRYHPSPILAFALPPSHCTTAPRPI